MKLAKKLLAVALAGVMAVSMLAGCSSSSSNKDQKEYAKALTSAVNSANKAAVQADSSTASAVTYTYDSSLDAVVTKEYNHYKANNFTLSSRADDTISSISDAKLYGGAKYAGGVLDLKISDSKDQKDESKLVQAATQLDSVLRNYLRTQQKTNPKGFRVKKDGDDNSKLYVLKGSDKTAGGSGNPAKVSYGVQFYSENGRYYAIIIVETMVDPS